MKKVICGLAAAVVLSLGLAGNAKAGGYDPCCHLKKVVTYECVISYECRTEAYQKAVTCYDHCGKPYTVWKTCYREVQVPVKKTVPVVKWVKVCD